MDRRNQPVLSPIRTQTPSRRFRSIQKTVGHPKNAKTAMELENVNKWYGKGAGAVHALKDISLKLHTGTLTVVAGPSGSGKSTLLSVLGCLMRPTSGKLTVLGKDLSESGESDRTKIRQEYFGFIFQGIHLIPSLTAYENVRLAMEIKEKEDIEENDLAADCLAGVGLDNLMDRLPKNMSGGQRQRVAIARALAGSPSLLLADEPTAALDQKNAVSILTLLRRMTRKMNLAAVVVTHDQNLFRFGDRVLNLEDGRLLP